MVCRQSVEILLVGLAFHGCYIPYLVHDVAESFCIVRVVREADGVIYAVRVDIMKGEFASVHEIVWRESRGGVVCLARYFY